MSYEARERVTHDHTCSLCQRNQPLLALFRVPEGWACGECSDARTYRRRCLEALGKAIIGAIEAESITHVHGWRQHCRECDADGMSACQMSCTTRLHRAVRCVACGMYSAPLRMHGDRCRLCREGE